MNRIARVLAAALLLALLATAGCLSARIPLESLPEAPIAMTYWDSEKARRFNERANAQRPNAALLALELEPGALVLYYPRSGEIEPVEAALPGARALAWSPDHDRLLYASERVAGTAQVYEYDVQSREVRPLTHGDYSHGRAAYVAGEKLALSRVRPEGETYSAGIYVQETRGARPEVLYPKRVGEDLVGTHSHTRLAWAQQRKPEGAARAAKPRWFVMTGSVEGEFPRALAPGRSPSFHPDGDWIVYTTPIRRIWQLRRVRADGQGRVAVGESAIDSHTPTISPDGGFVAYVGSEDRGEEGRTAHLFVRRFDGTGDRLLLGRGKVLSPVW